MKLHTRLTAPEIGTILIRAKDDGLIARDVTMTVFEPGPSMTHPNGYEIQLGTYDRDSLPAGYTDQNGRRLRVRRTRNASRGDARYAATWHEWGWFIATLFAADPGSRWGTDPARSRSPRPWGYFSPDDFHAKTGGQFRTSLPEPGVTTMTTLHAYRADGTEVLPGDTITMPGGPPYTFRAAVRASNITGTDGVITVYQNARSYPDMFSAPFGLTVRAVPGEPDDPAWENADYPGDIQRSIRGPGGFKALITPGGGWLIIDRSDGETVTSGIARDQGAAKQAVTDWEREHGLVPGASQPEPAPVPDVAGALALAEKARGTDAELVTLQALADEVRAQMAQASDADELAAEADQLARTMAPPVPGVTANGGSIIYAVLDAGPGRWWVAARRESDGERVTWFAETCPSGTLAYNVGHYWTNGEDAESEALVNLASRAGIFSRLTELSSGTVTRDAFRESHEKVLDELSGVYSIGRARIRSGLLEAAALGYARISWHDRGSRHDYGIRYDRVQCTFSWHREN